MLRELRAKRKAAADRALKIHQTARAAGRDQFTADEQKTFDAARREAAELQKQIDQHPDEQLAASGFLADLTEQREGGAAGSVGEAFVQSEAFRAPRVNGASAPVHLDYRLFRGGAANGPSMQASILTPVSGGGALIPETRIPGVVPVLLQMPNTLDLFPSIPVSGDSVTSIVETDATSNDAAEVTDEGELKPESTLDFDSVLIPIRTVATVLPVANALLEDQAQLSAYLSTRLTTFVRVREDAQALNGNGNAPNLLGILNHSNLAATTGPAQGDEIPVDAIGEQIYQIATANPGLFPDAILIRPDDFGRIAGIAKDDVGRYLVQGGPFAAAPPRLFGLPVIFTTNLPANTAVVGAFAIGGVVFRRKTVTVAFATQHDDYFARNLTAVRAESRLAVHLYRPGAFGPVDISGGS